MKKIILSLTLACCSLFMYAQHDGHNHSSAPATNAKPTVAGEVLVVKSAEHDFGKIAQGKPVTYVFEVTNAGKEAIKIENVQASCGCTTPEWDKEKAIEPGTSSKITVGFNAAAEGAFVKPITISYNGGQTKVLTIKGEVFKTPAASAPTNAAIKDF